VIVAIGSPEEDARRFARSLATDFVEIHLHASRETLALRGAAAVEQPYEAPVQPELRLDTDRLSVDESGAEVLAWLEEWSNQS
jgi:adenylylsulfate kinase-like enzyme